MDRQIQIYEVVKTKDSIGGESEELREYAKIWSEVRINAGAESYRAGAGKEFVNKTAEFFCRYDSKITELNRIKYNEQFYDILSVREIGRRSGLQILGEVRE